ncbi:unnamed protein product [Urochloa decumbens]|uniref:AIPP2-like SPOC-like domain-containing protein n=1 Tax=Urochloa decumbens TaxID=240449 RepID=A0ABC9GNV7_9POAL
MDDRSQQGGFNFCPRLKVANGGSKGIMKKASKEYKKYQENMRHPNLCNRNRNVSDQRANVAKLPKTNPPKNSDVGPSKASVAKGSKSEYSLSSKLSRQPITLSSKPCSVRNVLPSEEMETTAPSESKDAPNATSRCSDQSNHVKPKDRSSDNLESSHPPRLKAMPSLVRKAKDVDMSNLNNDAFGMRSKGQSNLYQGEDINVHKDDTKISKLVKSREVSRISNIPAVSVSGLWIANKDDSNKEKERPHEVITKEKEMIDAMFNNHAKKRDATKTNEASRSSSLVVGKKVVQGLESNCGDNSSHLFRKNHSRRQKNNASFMEGSSCARVSSNPGLPNEFIETNLKLPNRVQLVGGSGKTNDGKFRKKQLVLEEKADTNCTQDQTCRLRKKRRFIEENEDKENSGGDRRSMVVEHDQGVHQENLTSMTMVKEGRSTKADEVDGGCQNPVDVENDCEGAEQLGIHTPKKKQRRYKETNKYEDDMCDQHRVHVEDGTNDLAQDAISLHCVEQQSNCCSKPIDKPKWSSNILFKIDGNKKKKYISLAGHLSTKSCEKVWKLSFPKVVQVTKVPRLAAWPKMWKASKPTGDSIGLYFFPHELRHNEELDQLIKEVMDEDLALRAIIDEAEMLIFPSVLLPERHQTFQAKHYLWAAFKAKQDKCTVTVEQEEDKEKLSSQLDEVQSEESDQEMVLMNGAKPLENLQFPAKSIREVETCCVQGSTNMHFERESPEESRPRDSSHQAVCTSASTAVANAATGPSEGTSSATNTAPCPANHVPTNPSMEALPGSSSVFSIVVRQTPDLDRKVQQFIQEMKCGGELIAVMQGDTIGAGQWPSNITTTMQ